MAVTDLQRCVIGCAATCGLFVISALGQFASPGDTPPPPEEKIRSREPARMEPAGSNDTFSYEASAQYPGSYVVRPLDGSSPLIVSDTFLSMVTRGGTVQQGEEVLGTLRSYPSMVQQTYDQLFLDTFPDRTVQTTALTPSYFALQDGRAVTVTQDPAAAPYARLTIRNTDGSMAELSIAKEIVQSVLSDEQRTPEQTLETLRQFPFVLPENLRKQFASLSPQQWRDAISKIPDVAGQEFVRMGKIYEEQKRLGLMPPSSLAEPAATASLTPPQRDTKEEPAIAEAAQSPFEEFKPATPRLTASSPKVTSEAPNNSFLKTSILLLAGASTGGVGCYLFLRYKRTSIPARR